MVNPNPFIAFLGDIGSQHLFNPKVILKTADQIIDTQTTLQDVTDLVSKLKPSTRYYVLVAGRMISPAAADMDLSFKAITGTGYAQFRITMGTGALVNFGTESNSATSGSNESLFLPAWLKTGSAGGTLQLQYAQATSNAGDTKILEGTVMLVYEL